MTQVGYALGVAITGVIFFGAGHDLAEAFKLSLLDLSALAVGIVVMTGLVPRHAVDQGDAVTEPAAA